MKRYVRKGVPSEHRARIWMVASGAQDQLESNPGYYQCLLAAEHDATLTETIHAGETTETETLNKLLYQCENTFFLSDIHRTFPDNILFKSEASLQGSLFNVLVAYGHHNKTVGYCQVKTMTTSACSCRGLQLNKPLFNPQFNLRG